MVAKAMERNADWDLVLSYRAGIEAHEVGRHDPAVRSFRERWFPKGRLLSPTGNAVHSWVTRDVEQLQSGPDPAEALGLQGLAETMRERGRWPSYRVPPINHDGTVHFDVGVRNERAEDLYDETPVTCAPYGALGELLWLGWHLEDRFGWDATFARGWVVCRDVLPVVRAIQYRGWRDLRPVAPGIGSHRVLLDVSLDAPPARVDQELRELRASHADAGRSSSVPARPIAEWNLRATLFAVTRNDGRSWPDVLEEWNAHVSEPSWRYEKDARGAQLLGNAVHRTYAVLMGRPLEWKRKAGERRSK